MKSMLKNGLILLTLLSLASSLQAQSEKEKKPVLSIFKKKEALASETDPLNKKSTVKQLRVARKDSKEAKRDYKQARAEEQAAREQLELVKAERKAERVGADTDPEPGFLGNLLKGNKENPEEKSELKQARLEFKSAKKERKAKYARERETNKKVQYLQATKKAEKAEDKAEKAKEKSNK